jgi:hypothetical protein
MNESFETKANTESSNLIYCNICMEDKDNADILCPNNHGFCYECINSYFENELIAKKKITTNCTLCKQALFTNKLEAILNEDVLFLLFKLNVFELPEEYDIVSCPLCPKDEEFTFVINKKDFIQYVKCLNDNCGKTICLYCRNESNGNNHQSCKDSYYICELLLKAMSLSKIGLCAKCKDNNQEDVEYLKGTGCTHMTCKKCNNSLCYICGRRGNDLDYNKAKTNIIYGHNDDWKTNLKRCPMYLKNFHEIDTTWPNDDSSSTIKLYQYKIQSFVVKIIERYGKDKVKKAHDVYSSSKLEQLSEDYIKDYLKFKKLDYIENRISDLANRLK